MSRPVYWCRRPGCGLWTSDVIEADHHERDHEEIKKVGTLP